MVIDPVFDRRMSLRRRWKHVIFLYLRIFILPLARVLMRFKTLGTQHIPRRGGAVIVANHNHNADPILIYIATTRPIFFMTKVAIWKYPIPRWVASQAGAFPVRRDRVDREAIRTAVAHLSDGFLVGIFPEGTRSTTGGLIKPEAGASMIAVRAGAPIIPCGIVGASDLPFNGAKQEKRQRLYPKVTVRFGEPFRLDAHGPDGTRYHLDELTDAMMIEVARLLPESMRGVYAERAGQSHPAVCRDALIFTGPLEVEK
jgi:1-acyl-sn-glycerol-3-phosphate acyltransferase